MKRALGINAVFSAVCGIILVLHQSEFSKFFGIKPTLPFLIVGIGLLFFSLTLLYTINLENPLGVLVISILDLLWVLGSSYMLIVNPFDISKNGNYVMP